MRRDQMLSQIPFVLHHFVTEGAGNPLGLDVHVDNVLLKVERVGESFPTVIAETGLHTAPSVTRMAAVVIHVVVLDGVVITEITAAGAAVRYFTSFFLEFLSLFLPFSEDFFMIYRRKSSEKLVKVNSDARRPGRRKN